MGGLDDPLCRAYLNDPVFVMNSFRSRLTGSKLNMAIAKSPSSESRCNDIGIELTDDERQALRHNMPEQLLWGPESIDNCDWFRLEVGFALIQIAPRKPKSKRIQQGSYLIKIVEETSEGERRSTIAGLVVPYSPEYKQLEGSADLLEGLAAITGGSVLSNPSESFGPGLPPAYGDVPLTWWLLMAVAIPLPFDVALRRLNLSHTEAWAWLLKAKAKLFKGRVSLQQEAVPPILENLRQRRAGRPRLNIRDANRQESTVTNPPIPGDGQTTKPGEEGAGSSMRKASSLEQGQERIESTTERWLRAKRRGRSR